MARRSNNLRKSTNDLFDNDNRFASMYAQAFVDHSKKAQAINKTSITPQKQVGRTQQNNDFTPDAKK